VAICRILEFPREEQSIALPFAILEAATWMRRAAAPLPTSHPHVTFWAFPFALEVLKRGTAYYANNWRLDESISEAKLPAGRR
jgi:hypothetical protein